MHVSIRPAAPHSPSSAFLEHKPSAHWCTPVAAVVRPTTLAGMATVRRHVYASGRVQGVWYRESCRREAVRLGVVGWIRNLSDGRVEGVFEGDDQSVEQLVTWCQSGPPRAEVTSLEVRTEEPLGESSFAVR